ncbi:MAG: histidinol dehydrogenase [Actinobacteria bacterium]|nr:histidinol dehydrogenase [Actinomycetota bacterium]
MLRRIDLRGSTADPRDLLPRAALDVAAAEHAVRPICVAVRERGAEAVRELTERFDGVRLTDLRVPAEVLATALAGLDPAVRAALEEAARRARLVHTAQRRTDETVEVAPGTRVTERWLPVRRVGLYVPGGRVAYPSSVVMNVVPAQVAGVESVALASPPQAGYGGWPHPAVLAACALLGVDEVYAVGGAQAVAMFAYGVAGCPRVDLVTGPGNVYVAAAKRLVRGVVGIDSEAGPTEIAILADGTAEPAYLAADLIAQAEHDELAGCLLVTADAPLLDAVDAELARQVPATRHRTRVEAALTGQSAHVLVDDLAAGIAVIDAWAPEHLEVQTADAAAVAARVRNAGAIFVGGYAPVSLGDYLAGSNHVLPTGGTARHTGGLSVQSFLRGIHVVECSREALAAVEPQLSALGAAEELAAHVAAVQIRVGAAPGAPVPGTPGTGR